MASKYKLTFVQGATKIWGHFEKELPFLFVFGACM